MLPRTRCSIATTTIPQRTNGFDQEQTTGGLTSGGTGVGIQLVGTSITRYKRRTRPDNGPATDLGIQPEVTKKARIIGPVRARPPRLKLVEEDGATSLSKKSNSVKGKVPQTERPPLQRTTSIYPGRGGPLDSLFPRNSSDKEDFQVEDEADWMDDLEQTPAKLTSKHPSKFSKSVAAERPSWVSGSAPESLTSPDLLYKLSHDDSIRGDVSPSTSTDLLKGLRGSPVLNIEDSGTSTVTVLRKCDSPPTIWPVDTDLVYAGGSNKLKLMSQHTLVQTIVQDAIKHIQALILFTDAFPDAVLSNLFVKDALVSAAKSHFLGSQDIHTRLVGDVDYMTKLFSLVRGCISLFRGDVKEECAKVVDKLFVDMVDTPTAISQIVEYQLHKYHYIFPISMLSLSGKVPREKPYCNAKIISIVQTLYFNGGPSSFASRFRHLFPTSNCLDLDEKKPEVPIPMIALVGTALYASLHEWRTGEHRPIGFSANMFLDVYLRHINTIKYIEENNPMAFHSMMADIYTQVSQKSLSGGGPSMGLPIAELNLDELEV